MVNPPATEPSDAFLPVGASVNPEAGRAEQGHRNDNDERDDEYQIHPSPVGTTKATTITKAEGIITVRVVVTFVVQNALPMNGSMRPQ
jgi:hypothetical protein